MDDVIELDQRSENRVPAREIGRHRVDEIDLMLSVLSALRSPKKFSHEEIAKAFGCSLEFIEEVSDRAGQNSLSTQPMTYDEIGAFIGISPQAVGMWGQRAIMRLKHPTRMRILQPLKDSIFA